MAGKIVKIKVNDAEYTKTTNSSGYFTLTLDLQPLNNEATTYQISAIFEGDQTKKAEAYAKAPNGQDILICQTMQYGYKPASNTISLTVEPQSSVYTVPTKTPEEIQQEAEQEGWLKVEGPYPTGIFPPWLYWKITINIEWLGLLVRGWIGLVGFGITECQGLENILVKAFDVPQEVLGAVESAAIKGITTAAAAFAAGAAGTKLTRWTPPYIVALLTYSLVVAGALFGIYVWADVYTARATLFSIGFSFIGFTIGMLGVALLTSWHIAMMGSLLGGSSAQDTAIKATINTFMGAAVVLAVVNFGLCFFDIPFIIATGSLGMLAISLAQMKS